MKAIETTRTRFSTALGSVACFAVLMLMALAGSPALWGQVSDAPTNLQAVPGDTQVSLSWNAVSGATSYNVYMNSGSTPIATGITVANYVVWSQTFSTGIGLTNGTQYYFTVAAVNSSGTSSLSSQVGATPVAGSLGTTPTTAVFNIYPQVVAPNPVRVGFNLEPAAGSNITENAWLGDGGFSPYDARFSFTASQAGTATTFIAASNGGTSFWSSITTGYFVGATAYTYRYSSNSGTWSLLRTDTVTGYTALDDSSPADNTITFANSGPVTETGDIIWLAMDDLQSIPGIEYVDPRFSSYVPNWSTETLGQNETRTTTWPATLSTNVPSSDAGGLSLEITDTNTETQGIWQYIQGAFVGPADEEFQSGHTYEVSVWLMQSGIGNGSVTFSISQLSGVSYTFTGVNGTWQQFTWTFSAPAGLPANSVQPSVHLDYSAPGTLWVDNYQLYDTAWPPNTVSPTVMTAWQNYHPGFMRIWSNFGTANQGFSFFSLNSWLTPEIKTRNTPDIGNNYELPGQLEHLPDALANVKTAGANPWLIVNMSLSPTEWGELIDYLAAPQGTGYASMRPSSHPGPYTADFSTIYLEVGNEEWGTQNVPADSAYGAWANLVISQAIADKSYFNPSEIKFVVNGFPLLPSFGSAAIAAAPEASVVDYFLYTTGSTTAGNSNTFAGDQYYQSDLVQLPVTDGPWINSIVAQQQLDALDGHNYSLASYEEGPEMQSGGGPVGDNTLAGAIGAVDTSLYATQNGFGAQNLFLYSLGAQPFSTHTNFANGFIPHPVWEAYQMRNNYCTGPMVLTTANANNPTYSDPNITLGNPVPLIAVYTFADADVANQADVVVISRSLNNQTPVTLNFLGVPTGSAQLYTLTGDPRETNDNGLNIPIGSRQVAVTQSYTFTMPPGSMYIFQVPMNGAWSSSGEPIPAAPTGLSASPGNGKVTLTWSPSTGAVSYNVLRGTVTGGPYTQVGNTAEIGYIDTTVTNGTTYYYVVEAVNVSGASGNSSQASATPNVLDDAETSTQPPLTGANTGAWANANFVPITYEIPGAGTNGYTPDTAQYKTLWDSNYLYLLVSVQDSTLTAPTQANIWLGDTIEVYFSGTDTQSTSYGPTDFQYAFPYDNGGAVVTEEKHNATTGVIFGQENITGGYQMAMAIPWTTLGTTPVSGQQYGFEITVDDAPSQGTQVGRLAWWQTTGALWENPSLMGPLVLASNAAAQTINFTAPTSPVTYGVSPITLQATATSGLTVTFSVLSGPGTVSGNTLTVTGVGTIVVAANQAGNSTYAAAPQVTKSVVVNSGSLESQTINFTAPTSPVTYPVSPITLSATASSGLAVTFSVSSGPGTISGNTLTVTGTGTIVVAANQAGNSTYAAAPQVTQSVVVNASGSGTLLAYEPFGETSGSTIALSGASGGGDSGWGEAWVVQNSDTEIPGYNIVDTTPLTYSGLQTTGNYAIGGYNYVSSGRQLNVSSGGPFNSYLSGGLIGASGQTLWLSFLIRSDISNGQTSAIILNNNSSGNAWLSNSSNDIGIGYLGGSAYWGLMYNNGTPVLSNVAVTQGQPTLLVVGITFGSTNVINLYVNPTSLGGSAPSSPSATISTTGSVGFESLAYYAGNGSNESSLGDIRVGTTYAAVTPTSSGQQSQTINFTAPTSPVTYGVSPITLSATATSGLAVTFSVVSGPGTVSGNTLTVTGAGTIVVDANQAGNSTYAAAPQVTQSVVVNQASQTINFTQPTSPVAYGVSPITLSATASSGLAVTFSVSSGPGTISGNTLTVTGVGTIVVDANQAGNSTYAAAPQVTKSVVVNQTAQTINFTAPTSPVTYGVSPITLQATATSGLTVTFSVLSGPGTVSGNTLTVTGVGTIVVAANQAGNSTYAAAPQVTKSVVVNSGSLESQTINFTAPTSPVTYPVSPITLSATASSGLAVTFSVSSGPGTISGNTLTVTGTGTIVVAANQAGNSTYAAAPQVTQSVVVNASGSGTLLAYEPFGETSGSTIALSGASGGGDSGWGEAWVVQNSDTEIPGYNIVDTTPLTYSGLQTTGNYAIGGYNYVSSGRQLNVSSGGPFNSYLSGGLIGASGQTLWLSFLIRSDISNGQTSAIILNNNSSGNAWLSNSSNDIGIGYLGGSAYWGLMYNNGTPVLSNVAVTQGQPTLLVVGITFGSTNVINLYVNPTSLGGSAPSSPSATISTTGSVGFESLAYYAGNGSNESSLGDIRVGTTYAAVTP